MPELKVHEEESKKRYRKPFTELHQWMDSPVKISGPRHRKYRHSTSDTPKEAKHLFGVDADHACLDHIILDLETEIDKKNYSKKTTGVSTILNVRLPNKLYTRLIELSLFLSKTKSDVTREMIEREMIDLIDQSIYKEFEGKLEIETKQFFYNKMCSVKDNITLIEQRDKGVCKKCGGKESIGIFHLDGNVGNFDPLNLILLCNTCLKEYQRYMIRYSNKARFAAWFSLKQS